MITSLQESERERVLEIYFSLQALIKDGEFWPRNLVSSDDCIE